jgi:hypothetical protein
MSLRCPAYIFRLRPSLDHERKPPRLAAGRNRYVVTLIVRVNICLGVLVTVDESSGATVAESVAVGEAVGVFWLKIFAVCVSVALAAAVVGLARIAGVDVKESSNIFVGIAG